MVKKVESEKRDHARTIDEAQQRIAGMSENYELINPLEI